MVLIFLKRWTPGPYFAFRTDFLYFSLLPLPLSLFSLSHSFSPFSLPSLSLAPPKSQWAAERCSIIARLTVSLYRKREWTALMGITTNRALAAPLRAFDAHGEGGQRAFFLE